MLIRFSKPSRFIFIANTKTASSAIHESSFLKDSADIRINNSQFGKHLSLQQIVNRYDFIFDTVSPDEFLKFMVIREPLDWIMSWYNYRQIPALRNHKYTSFGKSFEQFVKEFLTTTPALPQTKKAEINGKLNIDFLIPYSKKLESNLEPLAKYLGFEGLSKASFEQVNVSPKSDSTEQWRGTSIEQDIRDFYKADYDAIQNISKINSNFISKLDKKT